MIEKRYRYAPARDRFGRPIDAKVADTHEWVIVRDPRQAEEEEEEGRRGGAAASE